MPDSPPTTRHLALARGIEAARIHTNQAMLCARASEVHASAALVIFREIAREFEKLTEMQVCADKATAAKVADRKAR